MCSGSIHPMKSKTNGIRNIVMNANKWQILVHNARVAAMTGAVLMLATNSYNAVAQSLLPPCPKGAQTASCPASGAAVPCPTGSTQTGCTTYATVYSTTTTTLKSPYYCSINGKTVYSYNICSSSLSTTECAVPICTTLPAS